MSVAAQSPFPAHSSKRRFEGETADFAGSPSACGGGKRLRQLSRSPRLESGSQIHAVKPGVISTLLSLFPGMDEKTVAGVLDECGNDIDAAIRRLGELKLSARSSEDSSDKLEDQAVRSAVAATAPEALVSPLDASSTEPASAGKPMGPPGQPQTMEQWVDALIQHMSAAKDMEQARHRGREFLAAFERAVRELARPNDANLEPAALKLQLQEAVKDNSILKRAVQIQAARMQDSAGKDAELNRLRQQLAAFQERIHGLEMSNYSLSMHLRQAVDAGGLAQGSRPPDVY